MSDKQKTIKSAISISGTGLHTGKNGTLTFKPAPVGHGYKFRRTDLNPDILVDADVDHVVDTSRGTSIQVDGIRIDTVEHVLAALAGLEIDNVLVELDQSETPIIDGSSTGFIDKLLEAGIVEQDAQRNYFEIRSNVVYTDVKHKVELIAIPAESFKLSVMIDYDSPVLPPQNASLHSIKNFRDEIARAVPSFFSMSLNSCSPTTLSKAAT